MSSPRKPGTKPGTRVGSPEWVKRVVEGTRRAKARERERRRLRASDLAELRTGKLPVCAAILPHLAAAEQELIGFLEALGGVDAVSPQRRALLEDVARLGVALRSEVQRYAETREPECASRLSGLVAARRSGLVAAGLERLERTVPDLRSYLAARSNGSQAAIDTEVVAEAHPEDDRPGNEPLRGQEAHETPLEERTEAELEDAREEGAT